MKILEYYKYIFKNYGALVLINEISCKLFKYSAMVSIYFILLLLLNKIFYNILISILLSTIIYVYIYKSKIIERYTNKLIYLKNRI